MKAAVCRAFGGPDVVQLPMPVPAIGPERLLTPAHAATVSAGDGLAVGIAYTRNLF
jgi:NADPH:quinone reductase-like Zn-dependent oxidoreductase